MKIELGRPRQKMFPHEILDQIMMSTWPGLRLGVTCRRLTAILRANSRSMADRFTVETKVGTKTIDLLPNGCRHGQYFNDKSEFTVIKKRYNLGVKIYELLDNDCYPEEEEAVIDSVIKYSREGSRVWIVCGNIDIYFNSGGYLDCRGPYKWAPSILVPKFRKSYKGFLKTHAALMSSDPAWRAIVTSAPVVKL